MSKLNDLLSSIISKLNNAATKTELSQLSAEVEAIGTQEEIVQAVIAALPTTSGVKY